GLSVCEAYTLLESMLCLKHEIPDRPRVANAKTTTQNVLGWLNSSPPNVVAQQCNYNSTSTPLLYCLTVTVSYTPDSWMTIMPFLGAIITKPLTGTAVVQIPQSML
ncbi:hypothetical protein K6Y79_24085, partial [Burkholderia cenocepacia]|nr:hypothetical protein [Burkholderia cenocepacia]MCW3510580.1 hypothetical protein [Burkholderia cenocepacia]MCW3518287.1 hypothetical protein [Burkholderia cenocepacia]MCW3533614.1 hypothetical protein [Burkholderia cenocepacia]MCW3548895.1 hypothetical protein [Burkholderia cenocepacia]